MGHQAAVCFVLAEGGEAVQRAIATTDPAEKRNG